jgi:hypothetical protein
LNALTPLGYTTITVYNLDFQKIDLGKLAKSGQRVTPVDIRRRMEMSSSAPYIGTVIVASREHYQ